MANVVGDRDLARKLRKARKAMLNVVPFREGPTLQNIPAMMRQLADKIETGEIEDVSSALFIVPREGDWPAIWGWGDHLGDYGNIAILEMAKTWFINNKTGRV